MYYGTWHTLYYRRAQEFVVGGSRPGLHPYFPKTPTAPNDNLVPPAFFPPYISIQRAKLVQAEKDVELLPTYRHTANLLIWGIHLSESGIIRAAFARDRWNRSGRIPSLGKSALKPARAIIRYEFNVARTRCRLLSCTIRSCRLKRAFRRLKRKSTASAPYRHLYECILADDGVRYMPELLLLLLA